MPSSTLTKTPKISSAITAVCVVVAAQLVGNLATLPNLAPWYEGLAKPSYTPPDWVFGPFWALLYGLIAMAFWRVLRLPQGTRGRTGAVTSLLVQIVLTGAWSVTFFGLHSPLMGLGIITLLLVANIVTIQAFYPIDRPAAYLLVPNAVFVGFISALNAAVWQLNQPQ